MPRGQIARKESHVKAHSAAARRAAITGNVDLPDPLDSSDDSPIGNSEDLLSQLAGDAVVRMLSSDSFEPIADEEPPELAPLMNPVQELTSQLDTFFEELRQRQAEAAAVVDAIPEANPLSINEEERAALDAPTTGLDDESTTTASEPSTPKDLIAQYETKKPTPLLLRPFDRGGAVIESLSPLMRGMVNVIVVAGFLAACAALTYVLILRA
jgi:hypothetical protein